MVDIHCHIVPDVDDGAWDLETALEMARMAANSGVGKIIATPHFNGVPEELEKCARIRHQFRRLQAAVAEEKLELELIQGVEVLCLPQTLELAHMRKLPTLGSSRYVLTEFFFDASRQFMESTLQSLQEYGYWPVVAHPERYAVVQREPDLLRRWFAEGIVIQVNKGSVLGAFGRRAQETAVWLLLHGLVHVIASDAHSPQRRTTDMEQILRWCEAELGRTYTRILLEENPGRIAQGRSVLRTDGTQ